MRIGSKGRASCTWFVGEHDLVRCFGQRWIHELFWKLATETCEEIIGDCKKSFSGKRCTKQMQNYVEVNWTWRKIRFLHIYGIEDWIMWARKNCRFFPRNHWVSFAKATTIRPCDYCVHGKQHRGSFQALSERKLNILDLIYYVFMV